MRFSFRAATRLFLVTLCLFAKPAAAEPVKRTVRIGVVLDGPAERFEQALGLFAEEIRSVTRREFDVLFDDDKKKLGDWTVESVTRAVDELLADPEVDVLLAHGVIASNEIVTRKALPKPCLAPFVIDAHVQGLAGADGQRVQRKNLSYIVWGLDLERDFKAFRELGSFREIAIVSNAYVRAALPGLADESLKRARALGVDAVIVPAKQRAAEIVQAIPKGVDAVYVGPNPQLPLAEVRKLAEALIDRRLPSFAWFGQQEVEQGILAGLGAPEDLVRLARRVALNMQSILLGQPAEGLITAFQQHEQLSINMATARAIHLWPNWTVLTDANVIGKARERIARSVSLKSAIRSALRSNLDLAVKNRAVLAGMQDIRTARAGLLPQLGVSATASMIDADRAGFGNAERMLQWGAQLSQLVYHERAWANLTAQQHLQRGREEDRNAVRLDVARDAAVAYLTLLKAKTAERIQRENLKLSRSNLALARVRRKIGAAGPEEVFRWEAQIANARRDVIATVALRNQAEIAVNRLLNRPSEEPFATKEASLDDPELLAGWPRFRAYLDNPFRFRVLREFMVQEGMGLAPELKQLEAGLDAQKRLLLSNRRALYLPRIGLNATLTHRFLRDGAGSEPAPELPALPGGVQIEIPNPNPLDWYVGVTASLPLYEGGARYARISKSEQEVSQTQFEKRSVKTKIEQRIRSALHSTGATFSAIRLSRDAADAARGNLRVVTDAYSRGAAHILALLDAQNQALLAELAAANAVYDFLIDLMEVERAIGRVGFFSSSPARKRFFERLDAFERIRASEEHAITAPASAVEAH